MFLVSQPDLSRAGTITTALNRWASRTGNYKRDNITDHLAQLARAGYIVMDEDAEELLIRSYIRHDEGWKSPNIMIAVAQAARQVMSETLRAVIRDELSKIDTTSLPTKVNDKTGRSTRDFIEGQIGALAEYLAPCEKDPDVLAWGTLPDQPTEPFSDGSGKGSRKGSAKGSPTTTATTTVTTTATATTTAEPSGFDAFWAAYPKRQDKGHARTAWVKAVRKADPETIIRSASAYANDPNLPEAKFIPLAATWLNGERWADGPLPPRNGQPQGGRRSTTDQRVMDAYDLAQRLAAQEAPQPYQHRIGA
jgi:hypothetical protein